MSSLAQFFADLNQFHFIRPLWLLMLPLLWGIVYWQRRRSQRQGNWASLIDPELLPSLLLDGTEGKTARAASPWPWLLAVWTLVTLALAGPAWQHAETPAYSRQAAWVVLLDLSPAMSVGDLAPSRYMRARYAIDDLLTQAHDTHVGLIAYSDEAYTVTPLTEDVATIRTLLPSLSPDMMPTNGNTLAPALDQAGKLLQQASMKNKHVIVLTSGFSDPATALPAAGRLKALGVSVDVVGVGTAGGAPLPTAGGGFAKDSAGHAALTRLDTEQLQQLASAGGGQYTDLAHLPTLIDSLQNNANASGDAVAKDKLQVGHWLDGGVWLLPLILLLAALLARRGWL
jgi:Ca-activated chloride channel family protein